MDASEVKEGFEVTDDVKSTMGTELSMSLNVVVR